MSYECVNLVLAIRFIFILLENIKIYSARFFSVYINYIEQNNIDKAGEILIYTVPHNKST